MSGSESPDTQAEAVCEAYAGADHGEWSVRAYDDQPVPEGKKYPPNLTVKIAKGDVPWREFLFPSYKIWTLLAHWTEDLEVLEAAGPDPALTPSTEPDGEATTWLCPDGRPCTGEDCTSDGYTMDCQRAPAQDGAEVEALARVVAGAFTEHRDSTPFIRSRRAAEAVLTSDWLAQRDKDRDAAVAAKVGEQIAQAIEAERDAFCKPKGLLRAVANHAAIPAVWTWLTKAAAIARAAAPAGEQS